jgi:MFS family permease
MGCSPATSGLLIGSGFLTSPIASVGGAYIFKKYSQYTGRIVSICGIILLSAQNLGMGIALDRQSHHGPNTMWLLIGLRVMCGLGKVSYIGQYMAYAVTPKFERTGLSIATAIATNLGLCLGPLVSALTIHALGGKEVVHSVYTRSSASLYIMALLWAGLALAFALTYPIHDLKPLMPTETSLTAEKISPRSARLTIKDRENIVLQGVLYTLERGISVGAIEAGTAMLLEIQFGWGARRIGLGISSVFAFTIVICTVLMFLNWKRVFSETNMLVCVAGVAACGGTLLFDFKNGFALQLLLADCLIYPFMYSASAAADGLATRVAIPDSWYSMESYLAMKGAGQALFRFMGFPLARYLIDTGGRNIYATVLLSLGLLGLLSAFKIAWVSGWRDEWLSPSKATDQSS